MLDTQQLEAINRALELRWGALFRVVFAENEFEKRERDGEVYLVRKYSYLRHCYLLEKNVREQGCPPEVKDWNGYEVVWPFQKPNSVEPIDPNIEVCMFITDCLMNGVKRTLEEHFDEDQKQFDKDVNQAYEMLDNESPYIPTMLKNREAIIVPYNYKKDE